jgi:hypothetical protein
MMIQNVHHCMMRQRSAAQTPYEAGGLSELPPGPAVQYRRYTACFITCQSVQYQLKQTCYLHPHNMHQNLSRGKTHTPPTRGVTSRQPV